MPLTPLHRRILEISFRRHLSHIGSCISTVGILDHIYSLRKPDEPVCCGNAHAGLALYCVLEKHLGIDAEMLLEKHGIHVTRDLENGIYVSGGSLGQVETVAMGMALADRSRDVWLVSSDGGFNEGSVWETLLFKGSTGVFNLRWFVNANGFAAYRTVDIDRLEGAIWELDMDVHVVRTNFAGIPFLQGLDAHYHQISDEDWKWIEAQEIKQEGKAL